MHLYLKSFPPPPPHLFVSRHKIWQRGSNSSVFGQCGGCRVPATLRDLAANKPYAGGYLRPIECVLDPNIGVELLYADNPRFALAHHEIMEQGQMVEAARVAVANAEEENIRYAEFKTATGCRGLSTPIVILEYTDSTTFFEYPVAHCMALGLHKQIMVQMRDVIGELQFLNACRRSDKRSLYLLRPSSLKRPVKRILPESSDNILSGYKVEDHQHGMECFHVLVFHRIFTNATERNLLRCPLDTVDKVYHLYWRFLSCAMFLFRGADRTVETNPENVAATNEIITSHRRDFIKDVEVLAKLCEGLIGPSGCSPNLHSLHHMIRALLDMKGHPTFEMIVERLVSNSSFKCP